MTAHLTARTCPPEHHFAGFCSHTWSLPLFVRTFPTAHKRDAAYQTDQEWTWKALPRAPARLQVRARPSCRLLVGPQIAWLSE